MRVCLREGFEYIPNWMNNKNEKPEDQIKVKFRFLSGADLQSCFNKDGSVNKLEEFKRIIASVDNLEDEEGKAITAEDIHERDGLYDLCLELWAAYGAEASVDKKK